MLAVLIEADTYFMALSQTICLPTMVIGRWMVLINCFSLDSLLVFDILTSMFALLWVSASLFRSALDAEWRLRYELSADIAAAES